MTTNHETPQRCGEEFVCSEIDYAPGPDAYGAPTICGMPRGHKGAHIDDSMAGRIAWMTRAEADKAVAETNTSAHDSEVEFLKARIAAYRSVVDELIRLYGWRNERGGAITDDEARQYGREKKAAWESARRVREADK